MLTRRAPWVYSRSRWKVAGAVAKAVVGMPMAIGLPVTHVPPDGMPATTLLPRVLRGSLPSTVLWSELQPCVYLLAAPHAAVWAEAVEIPVATQICSKTGQLQLCTEDKMALVRRKLAELPPSAFAALDKNGDGFLTPDELLEIINLRII